MGGSASTSNVSTSGTKMVHFNSIVFLSGSWYIDETDELYLGYYNEYHDAKEQFSSEKYIYEVNRC